MRCRLNLSSPLDVLDPPKVELSAEPLTSTAVGQRLIEAFQILAAMPGRVGPRGVHGVWPEFQREGHELLAAQELDDSDGDQSRTQVRYTPRQVGEAEQALTWAARFLTDDDPVLAVQVQRTAFYLAIGRDMDYAAEKLRRLPQYLKYRWQLGLDRIARALHC